MKCSIVLSILLLGAGIMPARAADTISEPALAAYYAISEALAADSLDGVADNSKKLSAALSDPALRLSALNVAAATQVSIGRTREMFKELNAVLMYEIKVGDLAFAGHVSYRVHCPMKDADWLQATETPIHNPYHGSEMLECGGVVATYGQNP